MVKKMFKTKKQPLVISHQRYNKLLNNSKPPDMPEGKGKSDLKNESGKFESPFQWNIRSGKKYVKEVEQEVDMPEEGKGQNVNPFKWNIRSAKMTHVNEDEQEDMRAFAEMKAMERKKKIAKAQELMDKLKPGPRELQRAVLQSELIHARNVQVDMKKEYNKAAKRQECANIKDSNHQTSLFVREQQEQKKDAEKRNAAHQAELRGAIQEKKKLNSEQKEKTMCAAIAERELLDNELMSQVQKEKESQLRKREKARANALEAMKMSEQRRLRDVMNDEVEDRLCCVYMESKQKLDAIKLNQSEKITKEHILSVEKNLQNMAESLAKNTVDVSARVRRDISTMRLQFTAEEQAKVDREKAAKRARIEAHQREVQQQKAIAARMAERRRLDMSQRLKNEEVTYFFNIQQRHDALLKQQNLSHTLKTQFQQRNRFGVYRAEPEFDENDAQPKFFFKYADELMDEANNKQRPLYPLMKVVDRYKLDNHINHRPFVPRHLVSSINIGIRKPDEVEENYELKARMIAAKPFVPSLDVKQAKADVLGNFKETEQVADVGRDEGFENKDKVPTAGRIQYSLDELKELNPEEHL